MNQEKLIGDLQLMNIDKPERLTVLRFYLIIFKLEKQNRPKNGDQN